MGYYERVELEIMRKRLEKMREELLRKTYFKIHSDPNLRVLKDTVEYVLNKMRTNIDYVFCTVLLDEGFKSKGTLNKLAVTVVNKAGKYSYKALYNPSYSKIAEKLLNIEALTKFIINIIDVSCRKH